MKLIPRNLIPLLFLPALFTPALLADETSLQLDPAQTHVAFTLSDVLHTVKGEFKLKHGSIRYDFATGKAAGEMVIDAQSGVTGNSMRDHRMAKNVLESDKFPEIVFHPDRVEGSIEKATVHGTFSIHGADHEMTMQVTATAAGKDVQVHAQFVVPYVQWGMKDPSTFVLKVGDKVDIAVDAKARVQ